MKSFILYYNAIKSTIKDTLVTITANEVKTKGVSLFTDLLDKFDELVINVRGKNKFVVLDIAKRCQAPFYAFSYFYLNLALLPLD